MMAGSHMIMGGAAWTLVAAATGHPVDPAQPEALGLAVAGSLLPDIDHPSSWMGRKMKVVSVPLSMLVGHRGVTHSMIAVLGGLGFLIVLGFGHMAAPLVIGYLSHLLADSLTPSGVPLLWPHRRKFGLPVCETGSLAEYALVALVGGAAGLTVPALRALL